MTNNFKAADLIGKELIVGNGVAKYIIKSVEGDTWRCVFHRDGVKDLELPMKAASLLKMVEEKRVQWAEAPTEAKAESTKDETAKPEPKPEPKAEPTEAKAEGEADDDIEEVDADEIEEPKPKPKAAKPKLRVVTGKIVKEKVREAIEEAEDEEPTEPIEDEDEPETEPETETEPEEEVEETPKPKAKARKRTAKGKYVYATYITHRGKPGAQITGFTPDEEVYQRARELHALASRERVNGKRVYSLVFGPNFADAARQMCDLLNDGAGMEELLDIVDVNYKSLEQKWAEKKAEYAEKKAKREAEKKAAKTAKAAAKGASKGEELYTEAQVKERIRNAFALLAKALKVNIDDLEPIIKVA